ncbi:MAG: pilus assembly protein N-terminal domain-containing protein [Gemmatimonadetes bacterium]|nr:pilus assembly protein N-terminal domain-containing protein [Gemmatimonadota bacterium]
MTWNHRAGSGWSRVRILVAAFAVVATALALPRSLDGQEILQNPERVLTLAKGTSALIQYPGELTRVSVTDPNVAEAVVMSPTEVLVNGLGLGTTSLLLWDTAGARRLYSVEVTADVASLQRFIDVLFPDEHIEATARGNTVILSGQVSDARIAARANELAKTTGAQVLDNLQTPAPRQILLEVRFAEVSREALSTYGNNVLQTVNPQKLSGSGTWSAGTDSDGQIDLSLINSDAQLSALIRALKTHGNFKSLAEPNLLALDGQEASFLAGGEFPFPSIQGGTSSNAVTVQWREFGVRLHFTPHVTNIGNIRLTIAPEVSSLDFAGGLSMAGFQIPTILTRKAETAIELKAGQHLAIAGLIDNTMQENVDKLPLLGDIPILGALFRSKDMREKRTELLVIVTPRLVEPTDQDIPVPTGEPSSWQWDGKLRGPPFDPDTVRVGTRTGG